MIFRSRICWPAAPKLRGDLPARGSNVRCARWQHFLFARFSLYQRHPGSLLFQAHFEQRGKRHTVDFIAQHPVLVVSLVKIVVLLFL